MYGFISMLDRLTDSLPYFLLALFILVGFIFFAVVYFSGFSLKEQWENLGLKTSPFFKKLQEIRDEKSPFWQHIYGFINKVLDILRIRPTGPFYESIRAAKKALNFHMQGNYTYRLPWFLAIGDDGAGKSSMLSHLKLPHPLASPDFGVPADNPLVQWWFFEKGIVLDLKGSVINNQVSSSNEQWDSFLHALRRYRTARPLDGLILTIPASYLVGKEALSTEELTKKGSALSEQLIKTESILGLKLPLYVVITKCDLVGGFKGFCHELPASAFQEIFGWANPHTTDSSYTSDWIKEAFSSIQGFLLQGILKIFSKNPVEKFQDDLMVFPNNFGKLASGLQAYLDAVVQKDDYADHFLLRGIYATGQVDPENENTAESVHHLFLKDLFDKKIFSESGLAVPLKTFLLSTNRAFNFLRLGLLAAVITAGLGTYWIKKTVTDAVEKLKPSMVLTLHSLKHIKPQETILEDETRSRNMLTFILQVGNTRHQFPSWITFLDNDLEKVSQYFYDTFIAANIAKELNAKATKLVTNPLSIPTVSSKSKEVLSPTETPEFLLLEGYVTALAHLHTLAVGYNSLPHTHSLEVFADLANYLYSCDIKEQYKLGDQAFLKKIIGESKTYKPFYLNRYSLFAEKRLYELYNNFLKRILDPEYNAALIQKLQSTLQKVEGRGVPDLDSFRNSLVEIKEVLAFITNSEAVWLTNPVFNPGSRYQQLLNKMNSIPFFTEAVRKRILETSERLYQRSIQYLQSYGSPLTGYFLTWSPSTKHLVPSEGLIKLEKGLNAFLQQPFMQKATGNKFEDQIPQGQFLYWDPNNIRQALSLIEGYRNFMAEELPSYPVNLQDTLRLVGREQVQANVEVMLERAQSFYEIPSQTWGSQADNAAQVQSNNISETGPLFVKLLQALDDIGARSTYMRLKNLLLSQLYKSLEKVNQNLLQSDFYEPLDTDFKNWDGGKNGLLKAYNLSDQTEMLSYFNNQSARVITLALQYAGPIVSFLKSDSFNLSIDQIKTITRWNGLLEAADGYEKGKTTGSMKVLEKFLTEDGNQITYDTCFTDIDPTIINAPTGDYFLQKRNSIMKSMYKRCQSLAAERGRAQYKKLADYFNSYMANSFPFVAVVSKDTRSGSDVAYPILEECFKQLEMLSPAVVDSIDAFGPKDPNWAEAKKFISDMRQVQEFFQTYFAPIKKDGTAGLSFILKFDENKPKSVLTDRLADWAFMNGDKVFSLRETGNGNTVRYEAGTPLSFGFEWLPMFPIFATRSSNDPALVPLEKRSLFVYEGEWAILRAMMIHLTPPNEGGLASNNIIFGFNVPLAPVPNGPSNAVAKLYVEIIPLTNKGMPAINFKIPKFPSSAPMLKGGSLS